MKKTVWQSLKESDKKSYKLYKKVKKQQNKMLNINANDNIVFVFILESAKSLFMNSYPEDYRYTRNLRRTKYHDRVEKLAE